MTRGSSGDKLHKEFLNNRGKLVKNVEFRHFACPCMILHDEQMRYGSQEGHCDIRGKQRIDMTIT